MAVRLGPENDGIGNTTLRSLDGDATFFRPFITRRRVLLHSPSPPQRTEAGLVRRVVAGSGPLVSAAPIG